MKKLYTFLPLLTLAFILASCVNDDVEIRQEYYYPEELSILEKTLNLPAEPLSYNVELPKHVSMGGLFARPINKDMATLGRVLFYDKAISATNDVSCSSCHHQENAFADSKALSDGVNNGVTTRNSLALGSVVSFAAYYGDNSFGSTGVPFMWDNRFGTAAEQAIAAITNPDEMGLSSGELISIVSGKDYYAPLFRRAFGSTDVTENKITSAIAEFVDGLGTFHSDFDIAAEKANVFTDFSIQFSEFTASENRGKAIYLDNCASCHSESFGRPIFNSANNGLDMQYADEGVGGNTNNINEKYLFKIPTLRNIALTAPYMHDGRFESLEEVVEFYNNDIADHPRLDNLLRDLQGQPKRLNLSNADKLALVDFLATLTDNEYTSEERYSDPFK